LATSSAQAARLAVVVIDVLLKNQLQVALAEDERYARAHARPL